MTPRHPASHRLPKFARIASVALLLGGCAGLPGIDPVQERLVACPRETVWEHALTVFNDYPLTTVDEEAGVIETDWREQPIQGQPYGLFGREGLDNKVRSRLTLQLSEVTPNTIRITLTERRQQWGFRGGARIYEWYPVPSSPETTAGILSAMTRKLEEKGCRFETSLS